MYKKYQFGGIISQLSSNPFSNSNPLDDLTKFKPINTNNKKQSKFGNALKGIGSFIGNNASLISSGLDSYTAANNIGKSSIAQTDPTALAVKNSIKSALNYVPGGQFLNLADSLFGAIGGGMSSYHKADKAVSYIPVLGNAISTFIGKTKKFQGDISEISKTGEFGGVAQDSLDAQNISDIKTFARGRANRQISRAQNQYDKTWGIINDNKKWLNNDIGSSLQSSLLSQYAGNQQLAKVGKQGMKFPELEEARMILNSITTKKFQLGGKMNLLPEGELHARKHDIEKYDKDLEGKITKKGIPVVTNDGTQTAEIEKEEWVLRKEFTDKIESLYKQYKDTNSDEIAIEAGKLVCFELLKNTDDRSKLIKNIK